jgi:hypothetical protein
MRFRSPRQTPARAITEPSTVESSLELGGEIYAGGGYQIAIAGFVRGMAFNATIVVRPVKGSYALVLRSRAGGCGSLKASE